MLHQQFVTITTLHTNPAKTTADANCFSLSAHAAWFSRAASTTARASFGGVHQGEIRFSRIFTWCACLLPTGVLSRSRSIISGTRSNRASAAFQSPFYSPICHCQHKSIDMDTAHLELLCALVLDSQCRLNSLSR